MHTPCQTVGLKIAPFPDRNGEKHTLEGSISPVHAQRIARPRGQTDRPVHSNSTTMIKVVRCRSLFGVLFVSVF